MISPVAIVLLVLLLLLIGGAAPVWPYSRDWGYYPSGIGATLLIIILVIAIAVRLD